MPKTINLTAYLYDKSNGPLHKAGITLDLYDASTRTLLVTEVSKDLNPGPGGAPSNEWGAKLSFTVSTSLGNPVDLIFTDASYEYPGNTLRFLNGDVGGRVDVDLQKIPATRGGQISPPSSGTAKSISNWIDMATQWKPEEKEAVRQLVFNYCQLIISHRNDPLASSQLAKVEANWAEALRRIGLPPELLDRT
jgi:hypothetical protein